MSLSGTASVVVSCKIPILATRVRFPGSALFFVVFFVFVCLFVCLFVLFLPFE